MAAIGAPSRFAILKEVDCEPNDRRRGNVASAQLTNGAAKKKSAKQKQAQQQNKKRNKKENVKSAEVAADSGAVRDERLSDDLFDEQLQEALLRSRLEEPQQRAYVGIPAVLASQNVVEGRKGTFSLHEFNELFGRSGPPSSPTTSRPGRPLSELLAQRKRDEEEEKEKLLRTTSKQAASPVKEVKVPQEVADQGSTAQTVPQSEYDQMLDMKKKQIEHMAKVLCTTKKELAVSLEQNADLESLLKKGELKKKVELLREVAELRQLRDELTERINSMDVELERERARNNELVGELLRMRHNS